MNVLGPEYLRIQRPDGRPINLRLSRRKRLMFRLHIGETHEEMRAHAEWLLRKAGCR